MNGLEQSGLANHFPLILTGKLSHLDGNPKSLKFFTKEKQSASFTSKTPLTLVGEKLMLMQEKNLSCLNLQHTFIGDYNSRASI